MVLGLALLLAAGAARGQQGSPWRLDDFNKTYPPNEVYGKWNARKFSPTFGSGERYFYQFVHNGAEHYLHLESGSDNSFSVGLEVPFRLQDWRTLEWEWRITKLPTQGDVRVRERDDQAGSVCVIVNPGLFGYEAVCYLFENGGPKDTPITSTQRDNVRYLILRTAAAGDPLGQWLKEQRNILQDYKRLFGKEPEQEAVVGFQIDSNDTRSAAEAFYRNIILRKS